MYQPNPLEIDQPANRLFPRTQRTTPHEFVAPQLGIWVGSLVVALVRAAGWQSPRPMRRGFCRRSRLPKDTRLGQAQGSRRLLSVHAEQDARRVGEAGRASAAADSGGQRPVADADQDAGQRGGARQGRTAGLHGREGYLESYPGHFVTGSSVSAEGQERQAAGRALSAWPLAQRPVLPTRAKSHAQADRRRRRAV